MKLDTLYSRTSIGQVAEWTIEVVGSSYRTHEGIVGGKITTSKFTECFPKNVGKKNETTAEDQALKEAEAKHKKKMDTGYYPDVKDIDKSAFFEPMLAHKWTDYGDQITYPVMCQPKLDGMRCIVNKDGMWTRNGKPIVSAPHIFEALKHLFEENSELVFDGELYNHELKHDFNKLISLAKKSKPKPEDLRESAVKLQYWVYDLYDGKNKDHGFTTRNFILSSTVDKLNHSSIVFVDTRMVSSLKYLDEFYEEFMEEGYEGQMVRSVKGIYENKRSKNLLKRKTFIDEEFVLIDLQDGKGDRTGLATTASFQHPNGSTFDTGVIGNSVYAADLLKKKKKVIGKKATVVYQNLTPDGVPRFGKMKIIRDYE